MAFVVVVARYWAVHVNP